MKKVMFSLVGEQTAPNLFLHLHFQPDYHYLLHSQKTKGHAGNTAIAIIKWAEQRGFPTPELPRINIEREYDWRYVRDLVQRELTGLEKRFVSEEIRIIANITSGTKPMNIGVWEALRDRGAETVYLDRATVKFMHSNREEPLQEEPPMDVFIRAYGYEIIETVRTDPPDFELLVETAEIVARSRRIRNQVKTRKISRGSFPRDLEEWLIKEAFLRLENGDLLSCKKDVFIEKNLSGLQNFWTGEWLSVFTWKSVKQILPQGSLVLLGTRVRREKQTNELDVMFFKDWKLWCFECKASDKHSEGKRKNPNSYVYKIKQLSKDLGGTFARPVLVTLQAFKRAESENVRNLVLAENAHEFVAKLKRLLTTGY